ncbi:transmembrane protein 30C [Nelusetta ayraudi]|uniref:transmembrane protein 30C n=1 Tax=Nelusetta ayraudi TaxID=303726 RepID=UPI003F6FFC46
MGKDKGQTGPLSRRPDNSAFKQQRLPAWSPVLTANTVLPFFYFASLLCLVLGVVLIVTVKNTQELRKEYTMAGTCNLCYTKRENMSSAQEECSCMVTLELKTPFKGDVFFYYGLKNFHQNLRRYMDSRDDAQTLGWESKLKDPSSYCVPFQKDPDGVPYAPCGAVANSMFNDTFDLFHHVSLTRMTRVPLRRTGLTWYTDKNIKFRNPKTENQTLAQVFNGTAKPAYWREPVYKLDASDKYNNGFINDDFIVWMREAAFPNFKKLYGILDRQSEQFRDGLPAGNYSVSISYNFPAQPFHGQKEVVLTTLTWFGGQNHFLPIAYLVTSGLLLLVAVVLTVLWWKFGKDGKNMKE